MFLTNTDKNKTHAILNSETEFKNLMAITKLTGTRLFAGREVKIRSHYTLSERLWEMIYGCLGYKDGIKAIQAPHNKKYLLKELVKFFATDPISVANRRYLKTLIKESQTFKDKIEKINSITIKDIKRIRSDIQSNPIYLIKQNAKKIHDSNQSKQTISKLKQISNPNLKDHDISNAIANYKRILDLPNLNKKKLFNTLYALTNLYKETNDIDNQIKYLERISQLPETLLADRIRSLQQLQSLYHKTNKIDDEVVTLTHLITLYLNNKNNLFLNELKTNNNEAIRCYWMIMRLEKAKLEDKIKALDGLLKCCDNDSSSKISCYEFVLNLPGISMKQQIDFLLHLAYLYRDAKVFWYANKDIEALERILKLPSLDLEVELNTLDQLITLYRSAKNSAKEIECHEHIFRISPLLSSTHRPEINRKLSALKSLACIYNTNVDIDNEKKSYSRILALENVPANEQLSALFKLIELYRKTKATSSEVDCHELILKSPGVTPKQQAEALCSLANIYTQANALEKAIAYFRRTINIHDVTNEVLLNAFLEWINFYHKTGQINTLNEDLKLILKKLAIIHLPKTKECLKRILDLPGLSATTLNALAELYRQYKKVPEEIQCHERILKLSDITSNIQIKALNRLALLYSSTNHPDKAAKCYKRIRDIPAITIKERYAAFSALAKSYRQISGKTNKAIKLYQLLTTFETIPGSKYFALNSLAEIYSQTKRSSLALKCYDQILEATDIDLTSKLKTLRALAFLCEKIDNVDKEIECYERILTFPQSDMELDHTDAINKLIKIYKQIDDTETSIKGYERILNLPNITLPTQLTILNALIKIYQKTKNITKEIEYCECHLQVVKMLKRNPINRLEHLIALYNQIASPKVTGCYEQILTFPGTEAKHYNILTLLIPLYEKSSNTEKQINCYERVLKLSDLKIRDKIMALKALILLYLSVDNIERALECKFEIVKLHPALELELLMIFLNDIKIGLDQKVIALFNEKTPIESERNQILRILSLYPSLWLDNSKKLTVNQWFAILNNKDILGTLILTLQSFITVTGLNHDYFLNDPTMPEWNILTQHEGSITDEDWMIVQVNLNVIFDTVYTNTEDHNIAQKEYLLRFLTQCMSSRDAATKQGKQHLRKRITAIVDYFVELKNYYDLSQTEKELTKKLIQNGLSIAIIGGRQCTDRAVAFVTILEHYIKLLKNPKYFPNVLVQMFKFDAIIQALLDPNQEENIETYLSYTLKLNKILGLGLAQDGTMSHEDCAKTISLENALEQLSNIFTQEHLLDFTLKQDRFKLQFEVEKEAALKELREEYLQTDENNELMAQLAQQLKDTEILFYKNKAKELFQEAGFLT